MFHWQGHETGKGQDSRCQNSRKNIFPGNFSRTVTHMVVNALCVTTIGMQKFKVI